MRGINAGYGSMKALFSVDLRISKAGVLAVLGPNGAGKTTTLRVAGGLLRPSGGSVLFDGADITRFRARARARMGVCLIPEGRGIFPNLTVRENLLLQTYARPGVSMSEVEELAYERFPRLGKRRKQVAGTMSGGEQQMLALSRALTTQPRLLLLDEISMGLAPRLVEELFEVIKDEVVRRNVTVVIVEQLAEFALGIADQVIVLSRGSVAASGTPAKVQAVLASAYLGKETKKADATRGIRHV